MTTVTLSFEVHQPYRLNDSFFWKGQMFKRVDGEKDIFKKLYNYYFSSKNREIFEKVARKCYFPANDTLLKNIDDFKGQKRDFKVSFSISGVFIEQCEQFAPDLVDSFRSLVDTGRVELLDQTYYHSLASLYHDPAEFIEQVKDHRQMVKDYFGYKPQVIENTEFLYNNKIAGIVADMGYKAIFTEGLERILSGDSPDYVYSNKDGRINVLLRNYKLTDDFGFRFSSKEWAEYPLTAEKFSSWVAGTGGDCINLFADYETFGEHHWEDTGIFNFLRYFPKEILKWDHMEFGTPSDVIKKYPARKKLDVFEIGQTISWADMERDISCWLGNTLQWAGFTRHREQLGPAGVDKGLKKIWNYLGISDHFYYMFMLGGASGDVHNYFSPYENPHNAFLNYMGAVLDFETRINEHIQRANDPFTFSTGKDKFLMTAWGLMDFTQGLEKVPIASIRFHLKNDDFLNWARYSMKNEKLAQKIGELDPDYEAKALREKIIKYCKKYSKSD